MTFAAPLFLTIVLVLGFAFVRTRLQVSRMTRLGQLSWEDLLSKLEPVPIHEIAMIAHEYLEPRKGQPELDANELWAMIGQADGLRRMYANAEILMALASYAQRWNFDESVIVCERMRRDGLTLRRATFALSSVMTLGYDSVQVPFSVQEAASAYYLMRARLLALYETSHAGRFPQLAATL
jgi:hypothetical protein